MSLIDKRLCS